MVDWTGQHLGNYQLLRLLGEGAFAHVYLGKHIYLGTEAAIKIVHISLARRDHEQFLAEARIIAHLEHPHIIRLLDFGMEGHIPFLIMAYAPQGTLRQHHARGEPIPLSTILSSVKQMADALHYAHAHKVIHRDMKPENVLVGRQGELLLSDFGIALVGQSSHYQHTHDIAGTVAYMAPEQLQGHPRPASDQYALGIMVYEWLTGDRPFHGSFTEVAVQHAMALPPPIHEKIPSLSPDIEHVILTALEKDPQRRFPTVRAFAEAFEQACLPTVQRSRPLAQHFSQLFQTASATSPPVHTTPPSLPAMMPALARSQSLSRPAKHRLSRRAMLTGTACLAALATGVGSTWLFLSSHLHAPQVPQTSSFRETHPSPTSPINSTSPTPPKESTAVSSPTAPSPSPSPQPTSPPSTTIGTLFTIYRGHSRYIYGVTWASSNGQRIASASLDTTVQGWDARSGSRYFLYTHTNAVNDVKASHDASRIASAGEDRVVQIRDAVSGELLFTYSGHSGAIYTAAWSPDDRYIASASADGTVQVWDASAGVTITTYRGHQDVVWAAEWSPDGRFIVSASTDGTARVWNALSGGTMTVYTQHTATVRCVSWSRQGYGVASGSEDHTVHVWNPLTGARLMVYSAHTERLRTVSWSHGTSRIVSGAKDATARIWDGLTGETIYVYRGHTATVFDAQWSLNDALIASGSTDTTVQVWQAS